MPIEHTAPIEFEGKILDVDPAEMEQLILDKGGQKVGERFMRRYVYDITPGDQSKWIRLRDTGDEVTLTVKQITSDAIDGTHETEVTVSDFAETNALLGALGVHREVVPGDQAHELPPRRRTGRDRHVAAHPALRRDRGWIEGRGRSGRRTARLRRGGADRGEHDQGLRPLRHRPQHHL